MTEQEWLKCGDADHMLEIIRTKVTTNRKYRLFAVACCRRHLHRMQDEASRKVVEVAEHQADGLVSSNALATACERLGFAEAAYQSHLAGDSIDEFSAADAICIPASASDKNIPISAGAAAEIAHTAAISAQPPNAWRTASATEKRLQAATLHCVFGNPFRPVVVNPAWLTPTVVSLATAIYDDRAFDRMPILADALEDAGCDNQDILQHCRSGQEHVRGCWVVDLVLGKS